MKPEKRIIPKTPQALMLELLTEVKDLKTQIQTQNTQIETQNTLIDSMIQESKEARKVAVLGEPTLE